MKAPIVALPLTLNLKFTKFQTVKNKRDKRFLLLCLCHPDPSLPHTKEAPRIDMLCKVNKFSKEC